MTILPSFPKVHFDFGAVAAIGGELDSDAMGEKPPDDTYIGMVRKNVRTIVNALK